MNRYYRTLIETEIIPPYKDASRIWSLRDFGLGVITHPITVKRDSDNTTQYFTYEEITDGTLVDWVRDGNTTGEGIVIRWRDQRFGTLARPRYTNFTSSFNSSPPRIVSNGNLLTINRKPAIIRYNQGDAMRVNYVPGTGAKDIFTVVRKPENYDKSVLFGTESGSRHFNFRLDNTTNTTNGSVVVSNLTKNLNSENVPLTRVDAKSFFDEQSIVNYEAEFSFADNWKFSFGFRPQNGNYGYGMYDMQEVIIFNNVQSQGKKEAIIEEQNEYYNTF